jgi:hypothetical protein
MCAQSRHIRSIIEPMLQRVMVTGEAIWSEDLMLPVLEPDRQCTRVRSS